MTPRAGSDFARAEQTFSSFSPSTSTSPSHEDDARGGWSDHASQMDMDTPIDTRGRMEMGTEMDLDADIDGGDRGMSLDGTSEDARIGHRFGKRRVEREGGNGWNAGPSAGTSSSHFNPTHSVNAEQMNKVFGGQTWIDFLRESSGDDGGASNELRAPPHTTRRPPATAARATATSSRNKTSGPPLPPLPVDERSNSPPPSSQPSQQLSYLQRSAARRIRSYSGAPATSSNDRRALPPLPALPSHSQSDPHIGVQSGDRKRRLTTADSPVRRGSGVHSVDLGTRGPPLPSLSHLHPSQSGSGGSNTNPIVLDPESPVLRPRPGRMTSATTSTEARGGLRRESDLVLPPWQPDADVTHCFVCGSQFTFFYRKHHCRKCGRVVCAACSPHRITIPRQFIVHPPSEAPNVVDLTGDDDENTMSAFGPFRNPALGGGEEVRVCNPCVPDPNYNPPPPYTPSGPSSFHGANPPGHWAMQTHSGPGQTNPSARVLPSRNPPADIATGGRRAAGDLLQSIQPHPSYALYNSNYDSRARTHTRNTSTPQTPRLRQSGGFFSIAYPDDQDPYATHARHSEAPNRHSIHSPPPVRREIAEEDECPICGNELPPKGPDNDDSARTQHVEDCIAIHSSSPPPAPTSQQHTSTSLPSQRTRGMSNAATLLNAAGRTGVGNSGNGEGASSNSNTNNRLSMAARGMYVYTATEKDCIDDEGAEAECVICFEEFEAGVKMARLVCFCKFHEKCIKQWWDTKGRGACPTHQLHD